MVRETFVTYTIIMTNKDLKSNFYQAIVPELDNFILYSGIKRIKYF